MLPKPLSSPSQYTQSNRFMATYDANLAPSATVTANGSGDFYEMGAEHTLRLTRSVTALSGSGARLTVVVQDSPDATTWTDRAAFGDVTSSPATDALNLGGLDRYVRVRWTLVGTTPSATFAVTGTAVGGV